MKNIYILLTDTGTALSSVIKKFTDAPYNHVSISLDSGLFECYSFGRRVPYNPFEAGFVQEDLEKGTYIWFPETKCKIYSLEVNDDVFEKIKTKILEFKARENEYKYSLIGLLGVLLEKPMVSVNKYFCSYFVAYLLSSCGIKLIDKPDCLVTPDDFRNLENLQLIYEGYLYDYQEVINRIKNDPRRYESFRFIDYLKYITKIDRDRNEISFMVSFIRPKKIYVDKKVKHILSKVT